MKFPADPVYRRADTEIDKLETVSVSQVVSGSVLTILGRIALTTGHGGRRGHARIICPWAPQYRHRPRVSLLCLSAEDNRCLSIIIGSGAGSGG